MTPSGDTSISSKMRLDSEWIFDLRTNPFDYSDDSGSDSSNAPHQNGTKKIDDMNGIDLSSREETVAYKPNPFSIAKINAAYRTTSKPHGGTSAAPATSSLKVTATNSGQKTIMEGFKTQALRRGQLDPIPKVALKPGLASGKVPTSQHQATRIQSTIGDPSTTQTHSFPEPAANTNSIPNLAGEPEKVSTVLPKLRSQPAVQPVDAHILTLEQHFTTPIPFFNENPGFSDTVNHLPPHARPLPTHDNCLPDCDLGSKPQNPAFSFSSPLRSLARDTISDFQDATVSQKYSSPIKPMLTPSQDHKFLNRMTRPSSSWRTSKPFEQIHTQATNRNSRAVNPIVQQKHNSILRQQDTAMHENASVKLETVQEPGPLFRDPRPAVNDAEDQTCAPRISAESKSAGHRIRKPPHVELHHTNTRKHTRSEDFRDAYNMFSDPDAEWSTLPSRKKKKSKTENSIFPRLTRPFLLPGLLPVANAATNETTVVSGRRIQMYLPPPPPAINRSSERAIERNQGNIFEPTVKYHRAAKDVDLDPPSPPSRAHETERSSSPMTFDENVYPSPSSSRLSKPRRQEENTTDGISFTVRYQDRHNPAYRPLSPPTSDMTVPVDVKDPDIRIDVDVQAVRRNYPAKRAFLRKVFISAISCLVTIFTLFLCDCPSSADTSMTTFGISWALKVVVLYVVIMMKGRKLGLYVGLDKMKKIHAVNLPGHYVVA